MPDHEARKVGEWIASNPEASALAAELGSVREAVLQNEVSAPLTDSREFYWSKISRQIEREAAYARQPESVPFFARLRRYMAPIAGVAAFGCAVLIALTPKSPTFDEISSTGSGMDAVTYHDQSADMTVVWLQDNSAPADAKPAAHNMIFEDEPGTVIDL